MLSSSRTQTMIRKQTLMWSWTSTRATLRETAARCVTPAGAAQDAPRLQPQPRQVSFACSKMLQMLADRGPSGCLLVSCVLVRCLEYAVNLPVSLVDMILMVSVFNALATATLF